MRRAKCVVAISFCAAVNLAGSRVVVLWRSGYERAKDEVAMGVKCADYSSQVG